MQAIVIAENGEEREFLSYILRHTGLAVARTATVQLVLSSLLKQPVDLVLLSAKSGSAVAEDVAAIRTMSQALILLYDPMTEDTKCDLLDAGVDLILERPYSSRILSRYVTMFLRRAGSVPVSMLTAIQSENIQLDPGTRTVTLAGKLPQPLTPWSFVCCTC